MKQSTPIHLAVPEREPMAPGRFDYRAKSVADWLQNLPVTNLGVTSRTIYESLQACNRLELPPGARLRYLEQLREIVRYIGNGMRKEYLGRELPLHPKPRRIMALAIRLLQEMALGYEICIETGRKRHSIGFGRRHLACALDRAIRYRSRVLLESWVVYQPPPPGTWHRLHDLYTIAEASGLDKQRVIDSQLDSPRHRSTPGQAYQQTLLLAAAGPQRMAQSEILDAYRLLEYWSSAARLVAAESSAASEALFRVPRSVDEPPQPRSVGTPQPGERFLITYPLVQLIDQAFATTGKGAFWRRKPLADVHPELSRRLTLALGAVAERRHQPRQKTNTSIQALLGLSAIHSMLCYEFGQGAETSNPVYEHFQSREACPAPHEKPDVWDLIYPSALSKATATAEEQDQCLPPEEMLDWNVIDISAGGYCLVSGPQQSLRAHVGELICIREITNAEQPWQLGAVRWIHAAEQTLQVGVQLLALNPKPIQLRAEHSDHRFGPLERGLLLPAATATDQPATLITPGRHYLMQRLARVRHALCETVVELSHELDATAHYAQFELRESDALGAETAALGDVVPSSWLKAEI